MEIKDSQRIVDDFHSLMVFASTEGKTFGGAHYMGVKIWKWPCDLFLYTELLYELRPKLIIETGTAFGGSALYMAHLLDQLGDGKILSIDIKKITNEYPRHPRISYLGGRSSTAPETLKEVNNYFEYHGGPTLVILDSDHSELHVKAELNAYLPFIPPGSFLVVEDTDVNGNPAYPEHGPGPKEALDNWLPKHPDFKIESVRMNKYLFSCHTFLRRMRT